MKHRTEWWGIQILSEDKEETDLLLKLKSKLPDVAEDSYGTASIILETTYDNFDWGFDMDDKVNPESVVLSLTR